jgi:hypothetical protein
MSRSIHTNIRTARLERRYDYADEELKHSHLDKIRKDLGKKYIVKKYTLSERKMHSGIPGFLEYPGPETVSVNTIDSGEFIHYLVSAKDLAGVMRRLPYDIFCGLHSITLCLGAEYLEEEADSTVDIPRDPFTGRICEAECKAIYSPPVYGTYWPHSKKIFLYAYVYDSHGINVRLAEPLLRLQVLYTFVHELAHHDDYMRRRARGRWLSLTGPKCEDYAESREERWAIEAVLPYLLETYPDEYAGLFRWIEENSGIWFSLNNDVAGEIKTAKMLFYACPVLVNLFDNISSGKPKGEYLLEFVKGLHRSSAEAINELPGSI